jgi:hypothetical protein
MLTNVTSRFSLFLYPVKALRWFTILEVILNQNIPESLINEGQNKLNYWITISRQFDAPALITSTEKPWSSYWEDGNCSAGKEFPHLTQ